MHIRSLCSVAVVASLVACGTPEKATDDASVAHEVFTFTLPAKTVYDAAKLLVDELGYTLTAPLVMEKMLITTPRPAEDGGSTHMLVQFLAADQQFRVRLFRVEKDATGVVRQRERAYEAERQLMERLEPTRAAQLSAR